MPYVYFLSFITYHILAQYKFRMLQKLIYTECCTFIDSVVNGMLAGKIRNPNSSPDPGNNFRPQQMVEMVKTVVEAGLNQAQTRQGFEKLDEIVKFVKN